MKSLLFVFSIIVSATTFAQDQKDIVDTAVASGQFTTLVSAVNIAGLVDLLKAPGTMTVFAPTDAAFAKIPSGDLAKLLADPQQLRAVLLNHIYKGGEIDPALGSTNFYQGEELVGFAVRYLYLPMAGGTNVRFQCKDGLTPVFCQQPVPVSSLGDVMYVGAEVRASNGVIQAIDTVLK